MRRLRETIIKKLNLNSSGSTLLEAMVSLAVFSVGILGMAALQTNAVGNNTLAEDVQFNTVRAMAEIEELMATDYLDMRVQNGALQDFFTPDGRFRVRSTSTEDVNIPGAVKVDVVSTFTPTGGLPQTINLTIIKPDIDRMTP